ncbi:YebC/PmpR family DNA-binding transcriptional regulator [Candidatus Gribaldobacteria bacterium]|nr:YebC/PmpR family DNA-binding transcriptional regulator [Candidatus Gribaldobacteria bacterium]
MSGHSHAKTVKRVKEANAAKKGKVFSKISKMISLAAKDGANPEFNVGLKQAIEEAKKANMPKDNIERAINKGSGNTDGEVLEAVLYEAIGPSGLNLIIEGITDNKNRALAEIRQVLQKNNFKLANEGAVKWAFQPRGFIIIQAKPANTEDQELDIIELGAEDISLFNEEGQSYFEALVKPENLEQTKKRLVDKGFLLEKSFLGWSPINKIETNRDLEKTLEKLNEDLDETDTFQELYSNL